MFSITKLFGHHEKFFELLEASAQRFGVKWGVVERIVSAGVLTLPLTALLG